MPSRRPLVRGTLILGSVNFFNRLLGIVSQALAIRIIGTEGYGLYQLSIPIFLLALVLATAGIPPALTRLVADEQSRGSVLSIDRAVRWASALLTSLGLLLSTLIALMWPLITRNLLADHRAQWCVLVLGFSLPIIAASSAFRAYFQGIQRMEIPALAQMAEQSVRVCGGLLLAHHLCPLGVGWAAAGYAAGVMMGESVGLAILLTVYLRHRVSRSASRPLKGRPAGLPMRPLKERIAPFAAPATLNRLLSAVVLNVEAVLIPRCLQMSGHSLEHATALYGQFMGVALTLVTIPSIATLSISTNLLPAVASACGRRDFDYIQKSVSQGIRVVLALSLPVTVALYLVPQEISFLVFGLRDNVGYISILAVGGIGLYLIQITNGILYGLDQPRRVLVNTLIYSAVRVCCIYLLMTRLGGLASLAWSYLFSYLVGMGLNILPLRPFLDSKRPPRLRSLMLASLFMVLASKISLSFANQTGYQPLSVLGMTLGIGLLVYSITLLISEAHLGRRLSLDDNQ